MNLRFSSLKTLRVEGLEILDDEAISFAGESSIEEDEEEREDNSRAESEEEEPTPEEERVNLSAKMRGVHQTLNMLVELLAEQRRGRAQPYAKSDPPIRGASSTLGEGGCNHQILPQVEPANLF